MPKSSVPAITPGQPSASELATSTGAPVRQGLSFLNDALLGFAGIGLFVGAFIIANTFTILIQQRTRELGLLRALGASGRQVLWSVIAEMCHLASPPA